MTLRTPLLRSLLAISAMLVALWCAATPAALAETGDGTQTCTADFGVSKVDTTKFPYVRVAFTLCGDEAQLPKLDIEENGQRVGNYQAYHGKIGHIETDPKIELILAIDASESMVSPKIDNAKRAAAMLLQQAAKDTRIGVVSFGGEAHLLQAPTDDLDKVREPIDHQLSLTHGTALYDGVALATKSFDDDATRRVIVLLSDGADTGSKASEKSVIEKATDAGVEVYSVGIQGAGFAPATLQKLSADTGGSFQSVSDSAQLAGVFDALGRQLLRGYWLEYHSSQAGGSDVKVTVTPEGMDEATYSYGAPAVKGADGTIHLSKAPEVKHDAPLIALDGKAGEIIAALPFALIIGFLAYLYFAKKSRPNLGARIEPYIKQRTSAVVIKQERKDKAAALAPLMRMTESFLGKSSLFKRFRARLEQAKLPLREVELLYIMIGVGLGMAFFGLLFMKLLGALIGLVVGSWLPYAWVVLKARKRKKLFEDQLADVLSTIASSLKAGHSFNQAIAAVIKETPNPTAEELDRVMTEARLGLPLEDALDAMSQRMGSDDFEFVVTTVNIQRTVGGSLSEILEMVGDTVRGRQQFKKKVKALTSMGSMSAYVLLGMPVFMAGVLSLLNHEYMAPLFTTHQGHMLIFAGCFFMLLGYLSCKKIVTIKS